MHCNRSSEGSLDQGELIRLTCHDLFHVNCINNRCNLLPDHTAPAGYACISCNTPIFPPENTTTILAETIRKTFETSKWAQHLSTHRSGNHVELGSSRSLSGSGISTAEGAKPRLTTSVADYVPAIAPRVGSVYQGSIALPSFVDTPLRKSSKIVGRDEDDDKYSKSRADSQINFFSGGFRAKQEKIAVPSTTATSGSTSIENIPLAENV
ncbi:Zinc finger protein-like 1 [Nowakowskiella sp. JEL0078]|nr:Zinc finger protein-like 1 [Nowakowskiella sp. JEL0078]